MHRYRALPTHCAHAISTRSAKLLDTAGLSQSETVEGLV